MRKLVAVIGLVGLLGTACREISASGAVLRTITPPADDHAVRRLLIRKNPFTHSSNASRARFTGRWSF